MIIYTTNKTETINVKFSNNISTELVVMVNNVVIDSVMLGDAIGNHRVLSIDLVNGDVVTMNDNENISVEIL